MTQLTVSIEDVSMLDQIKQAISLIRGVSSFLQKRTKQVANVLNIICLRLFSCNSSWLIEEKEVPLRHSSTNNQDAYPMTAKDEDDIERKVSTFIETTNTDKNVIVTMITAKGIYRNEHSECIQRELTLDDLFC